MDEEGMAIEACDSPLLGDVCIMKVDAEAEGGIAADAVTLNSDAAVGGSVGGGSGERRRGSSPQSGLVAGPDAGGGATTAPTPGSATTIASAGRGRGRGGGEDP